MKELQIPGYSPPSASDVQIQLLQQILQAIVVLTQLTEGVFRANIGQTAEEIEHNMGLRAMTREENPAFAEDTETSDRT